MVGYARTTPQEVAVNTQEVNTQEVNTQEVKKEVKKTPVIGFDMGGTSTDVSRFDGTNFEN